MRLWLCLLCLLPGLVGAQESGRYTFTHPQMGTTFRIVLYAEGEAQAARAARRAWARLDTLNQLLSDYVPQSALNQFDGQAGDGHWHQLPPDLWQVLQAAQTVYRRSGGAFDVSIGPLSRLWRRAFRRQVFPEPEDVAAARSRVNGRWIRLSPKGYRGRLLRKGMELDLGGIAKGYALDAMAEQLHAQGLDTFLLDGGGDLLAGEAPPEKQGWTVRLPSGDTLLLRQAAVATSGDAYRYLEHQGKRYSHLIDPRTGYGVQHRRTITVRAPTATQADAWASAGSILDTAAFAKIRRKKWAKRLKVYLHQTP